MSVRRWELDQPSGLSSVRMHDLSMPCVLTITHLALGIGKKAAGGTISSGPSSDRGGPTVIRLKVNPAQTSSKSASAASGVTSTARSLGQSETVVGSTSSLKQASQSSSALKGLMDQGRYSVL